MIRKESSAIFGSGSCFCWQRAVFHRYFCKQKCRSSSCELSQGPFTKSNFSMAFPYVAASEEDYLASRMEKRLSGQPNLVVFCYGGSNSMKELDQPQSESEMFSELINSVEMLGGKYVVLYVSDPFRSIQLPYHQELERFLAEGAGGNASLNSTHCDEVCQIKSSFLEGVLVGMVIGDGLIMNGKFLAVSRSVFILCMSCL
uniref:Uncharacterized protein n=1 Tax=Populus trichocarpa TaxID=3694 RepID=A0A3N7EYJ5_POPTR